MQAILADREFVDENRVEGEWTPAGPASHRYPYTDEEGTLLFEVLRIPPQQPGQSKTFRQRHPDPSAKHGWAWNMNEVRRVLYHLPEVMAARDEGRTIYVVEGEKDVESLRARGEVATTSPMGAGKWQESYAETLAGSSVIIVADGDATGRAHAREVRESLIEHGCLVAIKEPKIGAKDITDHFNAGGDLSTLIETTPAEEDKRESYGVDVLSVVKRTISPATFVIPRVLARGDRFIITGFEGHGKALALDTEVATPVGMRTIKELAVGDPVYAGNGNITEITAKSEVFYDKDCYEVEFDDGTVVVAAGDHLWETETRASREASARMRKRPELTLPRGTDQRHKRVHAPKNVTTEHIAATLLAPNGGLNHSVAVAGEFQGHSKPLPIDPYVLGAWLGDGHSAGARITTHPDDAEILDRIRAAGWSVTKGAGLYAWNITGPRKWVGSLAEKLRALGVHGDKHIPSLYLHANPESRLALVQGLMDTDGSVTKAGQSEFTTTSEKLATGMSWLLRSLGIKVRHITGEATLNGRVVGPKYRMVFTADKPVFHLRRKAVRVTPRTTARQNLRYITDVRPIPRVPVQCIQVADECHTYLVTSNFIPTHNSTMLRQMAVMVAAGIHPWTGEEMTPQKVVYIDSENHPDQVLESWQQLVGLAARLERPVAPGMLTILEEWDTDLDLTSDEGHAWMMERVHAYKPDMIAMGPLYNLSSKDLKDDEPVRKIKRVVNSARGICGTAFIMEHHAPHRGPQDKDRSVRPYGSSTFLRFPEFGFGLSPTDVEGIYQWQKWRFPRIRNRQFPDFMRWGKPNSLEWPWEPAMEVEDGTIR